MPSKRRGLPFIDANVFVRFVARDIEDQSQRAAALFQKIDEGKITAFVPPIAIFECVFTLSSPRLYHLPREQIVGILQTLLRAPQIKTTNKNVLLDALDLYLGTPLPFADCYIAATMRHAGSNTIYSFDKDFDKVPGIKRLEP